MQPMGAAPPQAPQAPQTAPQAGGQMDSTMWQAMYQKIQAMPESPQKAALLAKMARDYQGEQSAAETQQSQGFEMAMSPGAKGTHLGGKYSTYVAANPLEHIASGLRQYKGYKGMKEAREALGSLSKDKQQSIVDLLRAGLGGGQSAAPPAQTPRGWR